MKLIPISPVPPSFMDPLNSATETGASAVVAEGFGTFVKNSLKELSKQIRHVEHISKLSTVNQVELHELATTISETELKLKTLLSIRDSLVGLIQELNRMQF